MRGLAKFLPEFGWEPVILTSEYSAKTDPRFNIVETPCEDIFIEWKKRLGFKEENRTLKEQLELPTYKNKKIFIDYILNLWLDLFAYPDPEKDWYSHAIDAGNALFQKEKFDAIISSSSPVTSHLIAKELKREYHLPWIADLRDLWTQNHYYSHNLIRKFVERKLELKTLSMADALVTVSLPLAEKLKILHKKETYVITNGFDPEEINNLNDSLTSKFTITYTGSLYRGEQDPSKLFRAFEEIISKKFVDPKDFEIRFYGPKEDWLKKEIKDYGLQEIVKCYGMIDRALAIEKQRESHVLLLLSWDDPGVDGIYTGKLFEYLAAQRPILCIGGSKGVVKKLLEETNAGIFATTTEEIKNVIGDFYRDYKRNGRVAYQGKISEINKYSHKEMAKKFAKVLNHITNQT